MFGRIRVLDHRSCTGATTSSSSGGGGGSGVSSATTGKGIITLDGRPGATVRTL